MSGSLIFVLGTLYGVSSFLIWRDGYFAGQLEVYNQVEKLEEKYGD